ncbi:MAG: PD-(D/E)XK nuclease family protein [Armatimonadetes bacterium]|nr:PD-(D/E)XK nuclease family protein [Armatimonadota bacterium]
MTAPTHGRPHANGKSGPARFLPELPVSSQESAGVMEEPAEVLSPTQVGMFLECPTKWYFKYMIGLPEPITSSLAVGRAVDNALSHYFRAKAEGVAMPEADVLDAVDTAWADEEAVVTHAPGESADELHNLCRRLVACYMAEMAPRVQPALIDGTPAVQVPVEGRIADVRVQGYIDLVTDDGVVIDLKTKRDKPAGVPADHMLQVATYDLLCPYSRGRAEIHYMVKGRSSKSKPNIVPFTREIGPEEVLYAESIYPATQEAMRSGLYLPRRTSRLCSRKYCPFWKSCEREFGGRVGE